MSVTVRTNTNRAISVVQGSQSTGSVTIKKGGDLKVQSLTNVVSTDLQDGYTLIYDSDTGNFVTQAISNVGINNVDGGTY